MLILMTCSLAYLSVCLSVGLSIGPKSVLWQNNSLDPDVVWDGQWG